MLPGQADTARPRWRRDSTSSNCWPRRSRRSTCRPSRSAWAAPPANCSACSRCWSSRASSPVSENGTGYVLTNKLFALAMTQAPVRSLVETAVPIMRKLAHDIGQSCHIDGGIRRPDRRHHAHRAARRPRILGAHRLSARDHARHFGPRAVRLPERRDAARLAQALPAQGRGRGNLRRARERSARPRATTRPRRISCAASSTCRRPSCAAKSRWRRWSARSCTATRWSWK